MAIERWKEISEFPEYEVSNMGQVRRVVFHSKMTLRDVARAKEMRKHGIFYKEIAKFFGVTEHAIVSAVNYAYKRGPLRQPFRLIRPQKRTSGHVGLSLCSPGKKPFQITIHQLVAAAFLGPPPDGCEINHKNGIRFDNRLANLEYVTHRQNMLHFYRVLKAKRPQLVRRITDKQLIAECKRRGIRVS